MSKPYESYESGDYLANNPTWDVEDSPWKAIKVHEFLSSHSLVPDSICEVGCGAGGVLAGLRSDYPEADLHGFDIAPDASSFWKAHSDKNIVFQTGDFFKLNHRKYDVILVLDVIEHVVDPWGFIESLKPWGDRFLFHIPLDLSAANILRETPIMAARRQVGHIHYFTKNLALELMRETGMKVEGWSYSGLSISGPRHSLLSRMAYLPRRFAYALHKDAGVRLLGGESLFVLARTLA